MLTRKDYEAIAAGIADVMATIRRDVEDGRGHLIEADAVALGIAENLARYFAQDNERFDRARFMTACDLDDLIPSEAFHTTGY